MIEDPKWTKVSTPHGEQAPLGRKAFPPFPARPNLPESLLGQWLNTLEVTPISAMKWVCRGGWFVDREIKDNDVCYFLAEGSVVFRKEGDDSGVVVESFEVNGEAMLASPSRTTWTVSSCSISFII